MSLQYSLIFGCRGPVTKDYNMTNQFNGLLRNERHEPDYTIGLLPRRTVEKKQKPQLADPKTSPPSCFSIRTATLVLFLSAAIAWAHKGPYSRMEPAQGIYFSSTVVINHYASNTGIAPDLLLDKGKDALGTILLGGRQN